MNTKLAYYAHSMRKYNTVIEEEEYNFICSHFSGIVICPNKHLGDFASIEPYLKVVETTSVVYASEILNCIGSGVFDECAFALSKNIPVYVVRQNDKNEFYILPVLGVEKRKFARASAYGDFITK
jgi:hypothetical protein